MIAIRHTSLTDDSVSCARAYVHGCVFTRGNLCNIANSLQNDYSHPRTRVRMLF